MRRKPIRPGEIAGLTNSSAPAICAPLPSHWADRPAHGGLDGFFAARLSGLAPFRRIDAVGRSRAGAILPNSSGIAHRAEGSARQCPADSRSHELAAFARAARCAPAWAAQRTPDGALAFHVRDRRPPADRPAGPAHRRSDARERDLLGRFAFAGKIVICGLAAHRSRSNRRRMNGPTSCWDSAGCAICAPPTLAITPANARALVIEWISLQGAFDTVDAWRPDLWRGASSRGCARRRWCCTKTDMRFYRRFLRTSPVRCASAPHLLAARARVPRLQAIVARTTRRCACRPGAHAQDRARMSPTSLHVRCSRWRAREPQSGRADRSAAGPAAAAPGLRGAHVPPRRRSTMRSTA